MSLPPPVKINPVIKLSRWSLLIMGIFYGNKRRKYLAEREVGIREEETRNKAIRDKMIAEERLLASERDIRFLASLGDPDPNKPTPTPKTTTKQTQTNDNDKPKETSNGDDAKHETSEANGWWNIFGPEKKDGGDSKRESENETEKKSWLNKFVPQNKTKEEEHKFRPEDKQHEGDGKNKKDAKSGEETRSWWEKEIDDKSETKSEQPENKENLPFYGPLTEEEFAKEESNEQPPNEGFVEWLFPFMKSDTCEKDVFDTKKLYGPDETASTATVDYAFTGRKRKQKDERDEDKLEK